MEGLASIEEDVERKRVGKNPFDPKFTALTESPFTETSTSGNDGQEMETISRHIIVRMQVIAKQIAFLSKETAGQPDKAESSRASLEKSTGTVARSDRSRSSSGGDDGTAAASESPLSPLAANLAARFDLYRRLCQGLVTAKELLPEGMLAKPSLVTPPAPMPAAAAAAVPSSDDISGGTTVRSQSDCNSGGIALPPAPGILHEFIKHVKPFSVCFDPPASPAGAATAESTRTTRNADQTTMPAADGESAAAAAAGCGTYDDDDDYNGNGDCDEGAVGFCDSGDDMSCSPEKTPTPRRKLASPVDPGAATTATNNVGSTAASRGGGLTCRREVRGGDGQQAGEIGQLHGAPRKPYSHPAGVLEARLQGKRKLVYSSPSPIINGTARPRFFEVEGCDGEGADGGGHGGGGLLPETGARPGSLVLRGPRGGAAAAARATAVTTAAAVANPRTVSSVGTRERGGASRRDSTSSTISSNNNTKKKKKSSSNNSNNNNNNNNSDGAAGKERRIGGGGGGGGGGSGRGGVVRGGSWWSLSWSSGKQLRKRMEAAAATASGKKPYTENHGRRGSSSSGGGGGIRGGTSREKKITLSDPAEASGGAGGAGGMVSVSAIGPLGLVRCSKAQHLEFPAVDGLGLESYLVSLASPVRNLSAMKRAFQQEPGLALAKDSGVAFPPPSPETPISPSDSEENAPSDGFDFEFDLAPEFGHEAAAAAAADNGVDDGTDAPRPGEGTEHDDESPPRARNADSGRSALMRTARETPPPPPSPSSSPLCPRATGAASSAAAKPGGTCVIDLRNIWQRTGAVSRAISQASAKQSTLAKNLRESFVRLDSQHRQREAEEKARRRNGRPSNDNGDNSARDSDGEKDGRERPIDVETSMSVSLRRPAEELDGPRSTPGAEAAAADEGGNEGAARKFALVVSLAHVHNISSAAARGIAGAASSQLCIELGSGGREAIVTARTK